MESFKSYYSHKEFDGDLWRWKPYWTYRGYYTEEPWESYKKEEALYHTDNYDKRYFRHTLPKYYRNHINRKRRKYDRYELYKEVNWDYDGVYSDWNCKDADPWWYW